MSRRKTTLTKRCISRTADYKQNKKVSGEERRKIIKELRTEGQLETCNWKIKCSRCGKYTISLTCQNCGRVDVFNVDEDLARKFYYKYIRREYKCLPCD